MNKYLEIMLVILCSYLLGSINPSYLIAKFKGFDIRKNGSGNAGGSNALITMGKTIGIMCMILDIIKCYIAVYVSMKYFSHLTPSNPYTIGMFAGAACSLGHIFPIYLGFRGGKGLACLGGIIWALSPWLFLGMFIGGFIVAIIFDYICAASIAAAIALPIAYFTMNHDIIGTIPLIIMTIAMLYKHKDNINKIQRGEELHFSYLWKRGEAKSNEKDRVIQNIENRKKGDDLNA